MNDQPKKRGRKSKAELAALAAAAQAGTVPHINGDTTREPDDVVDEQRGKAQAYALRVWEGQSPSLTRHERLGRVMAALQGQGMSMEGVELP